MLTVLNPDVAEATGSERLLALGIVVAVAAVTFLFARFLGKKLKGSTRLGLRRVDRLAPPVTLLVLVSGAAALMLPIAARPEILGFAIEVLAIIGGFWVVARMLDVFFATSEHSIRLRHSRVARGALLSARQFAKVILFVAAAVTLAVQLGAADQLYLALGAIGAALAFAARDPIRNALTFASMVVEPPFHLGDRVRIEDFRGGMQAEGDVISLTLNATTIETDRHTRVVISNVQLQSLRVENLSAANRKRLELVVPVPVTLETEALREACEEIEKDLVQDERVSPKRPPQVWISGSSGGLELKASVWLRKSSRRRDTQKDLLLVIRGRLEQHLHTESPRERQKASRRAPGARKLAPT